MVIFITQNLYDVESLQPRIIKLEKQLTEPLIYGKLNNDKTITVMQ